MQFNVSGLLTGSVGEQMKVDLVQAKLEIDGARFQDVEARGRLMRTDRTVLAQMQVTALIDAECSRCLTDIETPVGLFLEDEFKPANVGLTIRRGDWFEESDDDDALTIDSKNVIDLSAAIWQGLNSAKPMNPLCDVECRGLCIGCATDLNTHPCRCE